MTDSTKSITLKLQAAKRSEEPKVVYLGNFTYVEIQKNRVKLFEVDACGRNCDTIILDSEQFYKLVGACI